MFVITADQVDSRNDANRGDEAIALLRELAADALALSPDRTSGDEVQALITDARAALEAALALVRTGHWRVGLGIGPVDEPLPEATRTATGAAFVAARNAVDEARRRPLRLAVGAAATAADDDDPAERIVPSARTLQAMIDLLLTVRARRTSEGWELHDLVDTGLSQGDAAERLGITPQAASKRAIAAATRVDAAAREGLAELLAAADAAARADSSDETAAHRASEGTA